MQRDTPRTRVLLTLLVLTSVGLIALDHRSQPNGPLAGLRRLAAAALGPMEGAADAATAPVASAVERLTRAEPDTAAGTRRSAADELDRVAARGLDDLLRLAGAGRYRIVPAQVVAVGPAQTFAWTVTVDVGSRDGVRRDLTVVNGEGLVGRVTSVGTSSATVLLAVDPTSSVGARLESTGEVGVTTGRGVHDGAALALQLLDGQSEVRPGDRLVTFGSTGGGPYVPGVPVGTVTRVGGTPGAPTRSAAVEPFVDFTALDVVGVVVAAPRRDPRDSVLPPRPTPVPTVTVTVPARAP